MKVKTLGLLLINFGVLTFLFGACSDSNFSGGMPATKPVVTDDVLEDLADDVYDEPIDDEGNSGPSGDFITDYDDILDIIESPSAQEGKKVQACFSYNNAKASHNCDRAIFDVQFAGVKVGSINLNNGIGGNTSGRRPVTSTQSSGYSVFGGIFEGKWVNGAFDVSTICPDDRSMSRRRCHNGVAVLSIIGEVTTKDGKTMWLQYDQGVIQTGQTYKYEFNKFVLNSAKPSFGDLCELE